LLKDNKMPFEETLLTPEDLMTADEIFFTSTLKEIVPVTIINQKKVGDGVGPITQHLTQIFKDYVKTVC